MSQRLTKNLRLQIMEAVTKGYIHKNPAPEGKLPSDFKEEIIVKLEQEVVRRQEEILDKAKQVGIENYLAYEFSQYFYSGRTTFHSIGRTKSVRLNPCSQVICDLTNTKDPIWAKLWEEYQENIRGCKPAIDAHKVWELEKESYLGQASVVLGSVTTTKQLLEIWPEIYPYIPAEVAPKSTALAVNMAHLRSKL